MKRAAALFGLVWLGACTFPVYCTGADSCGDGASAGNASTGGSENTGGSASVPTPTCDDKARNGDETGIDCGMVACSVACPSGQGCDNDADCVEGNCQDQICAAASCSDHIQNASETDLDCGGDQGCARCAVGKRCAATSDCDGGACTNGQCDPPSCKDQLTNEDETDTDCGGDHCMPCGVGLACAKTSDCDDLACTKGKCQAAACDDGVLNQDETDLDCGGGCSPCDDTLKCKVAADCDSGVCPKQTLHCAAPTCSDKVHNGTETDVDCGSTCSGKCALLGGCESSADCNALDCVNGRCLPSKATGDTLPMLGWTATASDTLTTSRPSYALDGNSSTNWISGADQEPGMYFQIDMTKDQVVFSLEMDVNDQDSDPTKSDVGAAISVAFSDDPEFKGTTPVIESRTITDHEIITFDQAQAARYLRISLTLGKSRWWRIDDIRVKR